MIHYVWRLRMDGILISAYVGSRLSMKDDELSICYHYNHYIQPMFADNDDNKGSFMHQMFLSLVSWRCVSFFCSCFWGATSQQREGGQLKSCDGFFPSTRHGKLAGIPFCSKPFWWNRAAFSSLFSPIGLECLGSSCGIAPRNVYERPDVFCCGSLWVYVITVKIMSNIGGGGWRVSFCLEVSRGFKPAVDCTNQWFYIAAEDIIELSWWNQQQNEAGIKPEDVHIQKASNKSSHSKTSPLSPTCFGCLKFS